MDYWRKNDVTAPISGTLPGLPNPDTLVQYPRAMTAAQAVGPPKQEPAAPMAPAPAAAASDDIEMQRRRQMLVEMLGRPIAYGPDGKWSIVGGIANGLLSAAQQLPGRRGGALAPMPGYGGGGGMAEGPAQ